MDKKHLSVLIMGVYFLIYPLLISGENQSDSLYSGISFTDIYHLNTEGEYNRYLYNYRYTAGWVNTTPDKRFEAMYRKEALLGRYAYYPKVHNRIDFNKSNEQLSLSYTTHQNKLLLNPHIVLGTNFGFGFYVEHNRGISNYAISASSQQESAFFNYRIEQEAGSIPFKWRTSNINMATNNSLYAISISATDISPLPSDGNYANNLDGFALNTITHVNISNSTSASLQAAYMDIDAVLKYNSAIYGDIDNFRSLGLNSKLQKQYSNLDLDLGFSALFSGIGSDSYLDIWPFTFLDTFLAHRTRIKQLGIRAVSPSLGITYYRQRKPETGFNFNAGIYYHHIIHSEDIILRHRRAVLYPFLFTYTTHNYNWQDDLDAMLRLPLQASYVNGNLHAGINISQSIPFKWSKLIAISDDNPADTEASLRQWQWGGFGCSIMLSYTY